MTGKKELSERNDGLCLWVAAQCSPIAKGFLPNKEHPSFPEIEVFGGVPTREYGDLTKCQSPYSLAYLSAFASAARSETLVSSQS
ncbi:hypothetical protein [Moorena producens]|uniref:hypothetical protein n=1 Tax=Moorena producens TaxID=1155739 RepID=UPI003C721BC2